MLTRLRRLWLALLVMPLFSLAWAVPANATVISGWGSFVAATDCTASQYFPYVTLKVSVCTDVQYNSANPNASKVVVGARVTNYGLDYDYSALILTQRWRYIPGTSGPTFRGEVEDSLILSPGQSATVYLGVTSDPTNAFFGAKMGIATGINGNIRTSVYGFMQSRSTKCADGPQIPGWPNVDDCVVGGVGG